MVLQQVYSNVISVEGRSSRMLITLVLHCSDSNVEKKKPFECLSLSLRHGTTRGH